MHMIGLLILELAPSRNSDHIFSESGLLIDNSEGELQTIVLPEELKTKINKESLKIEEKIVVLKEEF